jgi:nucleotidyltransferase/DNA polymerase involved in DNA repair
LGTSESLALTTTQVVADAVLSLCVVLLPGAVIAARLRGAVQQHLGFTCSAGIGPNKLLAKIGSAKNKPNKQTVVLPRAVEELMQVIGVGAGRRQGGWQDLVCAACSLDSKCQSVDLACYNEGHFSSEGQHA